MVNRKARPADDFEQVGAQALGVFPRLCDDEKIRSATKQWHVFVGLVPVTNDRTVEIKIEQQFAQFVARDNSICIRQHHQSGYKLKTFFVVQFIPKKIEQAFARYAVVRLADSGMNPDKTLLGPFERDIQALPTRPVRTGVDRQRVEPVNKKGLHNAAYCYPKERFDDFLQHNPVDRIIQIRPELWIPQVTLQLLGDVANLLAVQPDRRL